MAPRPVVDTFIGEVFFDRKCGKQGDPLREEFYKWCSGEIKESKGAICYELAGGGENLKCNVTVRWDPDTNQPLEPPDFPNYKPTGVVWSIFCPNEINPEKSGILNNAYSKFTDERELIEATKICRQELYGVEGLPWWLILLIILGVLLIVAGAFALFWKFFLRQKIYGRNQSKMGSNFTSEAFTAREIAAARNSRRSKPTRSQSYRTSR